MKMKPIQTADGSWTLYSEKFQEHYHSTKDGAFNEALYKHVFPALSLMKKRDLLIFDSNFGLGFNSLTTISTILSSSRRVVIHSTEIDRGLVQSLKEFPYHPFFEPLKDIIKSLSEKGEYISNSVEVYIHFQDTREFLQSWQGEKFDIIYQDPFSPKVAPQFWSVEYFGLIKNVSHSETIITTYSTATPVRLALYENGFRVYSYTPEKVREGTIASMKELASLVEIDMEHKKRVSSKQPIWDRDY